MLLLWEEKKVRRTVAGLLTRCTDIHKMKKYVSSSTSCFPPPPFPLSVSHEGFWTTNKVLLGGARHGCPSTAWPAKEANQLMSCKPNHEKVSVARRTRHLPTRLRPPGSLSNVLGKSQKMPFNFCPFYFPHHHLHWCFLLPLPILTQTSSHETEPAEHVPQTQQLLWPLLV